MTANNAITRALCNGKTLAFQAKDTGSIPVARSKSQVLDFTVLLHGIPLFFL